MVNWSWCPRTAPSNWHSRHHSVARRPLPAEEVLSDASEKVMMTSKRLLRTASLDVDTLKALRHESRRSGVAMSDLVRRYLELGMLVSAARSKVKSQHSRRFKRRSMVGPRLPFEGITDDPNVQPEEGRMPASRTPPASSTLKQPRICFGRLKGKLRVPDDFDAPLPNEEVQRFE